MKKVLILLVFIGVAFALTKNSPPYDFTAGTPAKASEVNINFDSCDSKLDQIVDTINRMRTTATIDTAIIDSAAIDTASINAILGNPFIDTVTTNAIRSNPDVDSISGNPFIDTVTTNAIRSNPDVDSISGNPFIDTVTTKKVSVTDGTDSYFFGITSDKLTLYNDKTVPDTLIRIDSLGRFGFGVVPAALIHAVGPGGSAQYIVLSNTDAGLALTDGFQFGMLNDENAFINQRENKAISIYTNNTEVMKIDSAGNVGIDTTPAAKHHVNGSAIIEDTCTASKFKTGTGIFDYTEGTFACSLFDGSTATAVYEASATAKYVKIGKKMSILFPAMLGTKDSSNMYIKVPDLAWSETQKYVSLPVLRSGGVVKAGIIEMSTGHGRWYLLDADLTSIDNGSCGTTGTGIGVIINYSLQ